MMDDRIDDLLTDYFQPQAPPPDLAARVVRATRETGRSIEAFAARLTIRATPRGVCFIRPGRPEMPGSAGERRLVERTREELVEYLGGRRAFFGVAVDLSAVPEFQRRVLDAAAEIPFGEARPYAWVAARIGHGRAVRAVGTALGRNPVPFIVPCHRVVRSDGTIGQYGMGSALKARLLDLERTTPVLEGCSTTHIVCRVGCPRGSRMRPDRRVVFASVEDARSVGYRPCAVCRPGRSARRR
jgi:O-6-methylguanine DNA methyltransferase